jgi:hypothetical protein
MKRDELIDLVRRMRFAQRRYGRMKMAIDLRIANDLERHVDAALTKIKADTEPRLFQEAGHGG